MFGFLRPEQVDAISNAAEVIWYSAGESKLQAIVMTLPLEAEPQAGTHSMSRAGV